LKLQLEEEKMSQVSTCIPKPLLSWAVATVIMTGVGVTTLEATEWQARAGAETADRGSQALAFLPNEFWIHSGDSIRWTFPTHERHAVSFLTPGQTRPPGFGPNFGVLAGCPGVTPDGSSFDGSACVTSDILLLDASAGPGSPAPTYSVSFPATGNFKLVCLVHADMTGVIHGKDWHARSFALSSNQRETEPACLVVGPCKDWHAGPSR
jgi:plastocyanin